MLASVPLWLLAALAVVQAVAGDGTDRAALERQAAELRSMVAKAPALPFEQSRLGITPPQASWELGMVSWIASGRDGRIYLLHRGTKADPVVVLNPDGTVLRSWGAGLYTMPHAIRLDPQGNVWTTDAASSVVYKFSPDGRTMLTIRVGGQPTACPNNFCGTTDVAFAKNGHVFISDGYANARILEYDGDGTRLRAWGTAGTGPGQFRLPHSIAIDDEQVIYVADRENGRVQRFDTSGRFLGEWTTYGKTFGLALDGGAIWLSTQPRSDPNLSPGWLLKVDRKTGSLLGAVPSAGNHGMSVLPSGDLLQAPGPNLVPQIYRKK
jgi:DNA-binding beta-propeller fold protein YncE